MTRCSKCGVMVDSQHKNCPLCSKPLSNAGESITQYPSYLDLYSRVRNFTIEKLFLFLTISTIVITITINLLTLQINSSPWSAVVTALLLYAWVAVRNTFISKTHSGGKTLFQFLSLSVLLLILDICGGFSKWSTNYVIPFLSLAATFIITLMAIAKKSLWHEYIGYLLATFFISLCPLLFFAFRLSTVLWTSVVSIIYSLLTIVGLIIFSDRNFKEEMKKRFYF